MNMQFTVYMTEHYRVHLTVHDIFKQRVLELMLYLYKSFSLRHFLLEFSMQIWNKRFPCVMDNVIGHGHSITQACKLICTSCAINFITLHWYSTLLNQQQCNSVRVCLYFHYVWPYPRCSMLIFNQSATFQFRNFSVSNLFQTNNDFRIRNQKNLVSKKVSDSVSDKFGIRKSFKFSFVQILGIVTHW